MIKARLTDKQRIIEILSYAFEQNASVNFMAGKGKDRNLRIQRLMDYAFEVCMADGKVVLSGDQNACALVLLKKRFSLRSLWLDLRLIFGVVGMANIKKVLRRESLIKARHPEGDFYYLWFIGVHPAFIGRGIGSGFLKEVIADAESLGLPVYLETSTFQNIPWYKKFGFQVFSEIDIGYKLFFLRREFA